MELHTDSEDVTELQMGVVDHMNAPHDSLDGSCAHTSNSLHEDDTALHSGSFPVHVGGVIWSCAAPLATVLVASTMAVPAMSCAVMAAIPASANVCASSGSLSAAFTPACIRPVRSGARSDTNPDTSLSIILGPFTAAPMITMRTIAISTTIKAMIITLHMVLDFPIMFLQQGTQRCPVRRTRKGKGKREAGCESLLFLPVDFKAPVSVLLKGATLKTMPGKRITDRAMAYASRIRRGNLASPSPIRSSRKNRMSGNRVRTAARGVVFGDPYPGAAYDSFDYSDVDPGMVGGGECDPYDSPGDSEDEEPYAQPHADWYVSSSSDSDTDADAPGLVLPPKLVTGSGSDTDMGIADAEDDPLGYDTEKDTPGMAGVMLDSDSDTEQDTPGVYAPSPGLDSDSDSGGHTTSGYESFYESEDLLGDDYSYHDEDDAPPPLEENVS